MADRSDHLPTTGGDAPVFAAVGHYSCTDVVQNSVHRQNEQHSQQLHVHLPEAGEDGAAIGCRCAEDWEEEKCIPEVQWRNPEVGKERCLWDSDACWRRWGEIEKTLDHWRKKISYYNI